jgi:4-aminobutyrate aminotransferase-like enzyme
MIEERKYKCADLKEWSFKQRQRLKTNHQKLFKKIDEAPFGKNAKKQAKKWAQNESFGTVGWALFSTTPIIERAEGSILYDVDGKEYLDLLSGLSVNQFGNCQKDITKIIQNQAAKLTHYFDFPHPERIKLGEKLIKNSKMSGKIKVAFGVTGSDSIELAVRAARYYTGNPYIITAYGDYHGVTYGTMGLTSKGGMQLYFHPVTPDQLVGYFHFPHEYRTPKDDYPGWGLEALKIFERALESKETPYTEGCTGINNVAAILVEPFQSSAGYYIPPLEYLQEIRRICDKFGMLMIVDEIQAGLGRSGKVWAFEHSGIEPDMICTSKALGGGLPISAVIARSEILSEWGPTAHVSTQAGNVVACAAGNYVIDLVSSQKFLKQVNHVGSYFYEGLKELQKKHQIVGYIDNMGIYTGIELVNNRKTKEPAIEAATFIRDSAVEKGLLFEKGGYYHNRLQCIPALNISESILDEVLEKFDNLFWEAEKKFGIK